MQDRGAKRKTQTQEISGLDLFDKNGDKKISRDEPMTILRSLGNNPSESEISETIIEADTDSKSP